MIFQNPGLIDIDAVKTLGINAKSSSNPIGYFGTGLKYAIAVLLRNGCSITIYRGLERYVFDTEKLSVRGQEFSRVTLNGESLGFTTDLGKDWSLREAYRELYCNCKDEEGEVLYLDEASPRPDFTTIVVSGLDHIHEDRFSFILDPTRKPVLRTDYLEVYPGSNVQVFYRGIAVGKLAQPCTYTYNFTKKIPLTENRTMANSWEVESDIAEMWAKCNQQHLIESALADASMCEANLRWSWTNPSPTWVAAVRSLLQTRDTVADGVKSRYYRAMGKRLSFEPREQALSPEQVSELGAACKFCLAAGFPVTDYRITLATGLPRNTIACAENNTIWLSPEAFETDYVLRVALLEEFIHLRHEVGDYTREMQNRLFQEIIRLATIITNETQEES